MSITYFILNRIEFVTLLFKTILKNTFVTKRYFATYIACKFEIFHKVIYNIYSKVGHA